MFNPHGQDVGRSFPSDSAATLTDTDSAPRQRMEAGDCVRLASGGAVMTIERADYLAPTPHAFCSWMDARVKLHRATFKLAALERVIRKEDNTAP